MGPPCNYSMASGHLEIKRWGIYLVDLDPRIGTKPGKTRPCVVVQDDIFNQSGHLSTVVLPITSKNVNRKNFPLRVFLPEQESGLEKDSMILVDQFLAWDNRRFIRKIDDLTKDKREELKLAICDFFGF